MFDDSPFQLTFQASQHACPILENQMVKQQRSQMLSIFVCALLRHQPQKPVQLGQFVPALLTGTFSVGRPVTGAFFSLSKAIFLDHTAACGQQCIASTHYAKSIIEAIYYLKQVMCYMSALSKSKAIVGSQTILETQTDVVRRKHLSSCRE